MVSSFRASAIKAFFFPRRETSFQYLLESSVFLDLVTAQADSHKAVLMWGLPFTAFVLFFYQRFRDCQEQRLPMMPSDLLYEIDPYRHQFIQGVAAVSSLTPGMV